MRFRKRPVVVEAEQLLWTNWEAICDLMHFNMPSCGGTARRLTPSEAKALFPDTKIDTDTGDPAIYALIPTMEGNVLACEGDWIIRGVVGELYPCKPDVFEQVYDPVPGEDESMGDVMFVSPQRKQIDLGRRLKAAVDRAEALERALRVILHHVGVTQSPRVFMRNAVALPGSCPTIVVINQRLYDAIVAAHKVLKEGE